MKSTTCRLVIACAAASAGASEQTVDQPAEPDATPETAAANDAAPDTISTDANVDTAPADAAPEVDPPDAAPVDPCQLNGTPLYGNVHVATNFTAGEIKVAYVTAFPDLKVKWTDFPNLAVSCGIWHENNLAYDFTVRVVDANTGFPDLKIKDVTSSAEPPGLP
jgi:hypothetical protein